ncbi:hypothetical protein OS493_009739 [Desmophyllum pertusum]|uniref:Uncharacterized protein n=1 Tax=Desmophyllum pertusum TaxID=174260 RepID=A0A9X0CNR2_9CNID|nr:hypothetical protein OS493_009739 [Desmophyllum pertusum]
MKFGSWTYDGYRLDVILESEEGEIKKYVTNGEWDLIGVPAQRNEIIYVCCPQPYPDVTFTVHIRRRTISDTAVVLPPPDSGERITLVITNLLAMTVFMLIVAEIMPATSEVIPLISIYYTGIMFEVALSLVATCMVLKCYYSNPSVSEMPTWKRKRKYERRLSTRGVLPASNNQSYARKDVQVVSCPMEENRAMTFLSERRSSCASSLGLPQLFHTCANSLHSINEEPPIREALPPNVPLSLESSMKEMLLKQENLLRNVRRLVHVARETEENEIKKEEWKMVASVIDACFFWMFLAALIVSSLVIFLQAPTY